MVGLTYCLIKNCRDILLKTELKERENWVNKVQSTLLWARYNKFIDMWEINDRHGDLDMPFKPIIDYNGKKSFEATHCVSYGFWREGETLLFVGSIKISLMRLFHEIYRQHFFH